MKQTIKNKVLFPVILEVPEYEKNLKGRKKVEALSALARVALEISSVKSGVNLGCIKKNEDGVPVPFDGNFWSVTHKTEYVGGVIAQMETGIDIEKIKPCSKALCNKIAGPQEWALSDSDREILFFRFWTSKEAVLKAAGTGISGLSGCRIEKILCDNSLIVNFNNKIWEIKHYLFSDHIASVVANGFDIEWTLVNRNSILAV
ncbi:MAG: 4'-phosphopantetheinyl transferase superfamily protein [Desulfobacteraceae bacterium]|nr:MAG: 4'-phosphopantetheinyl transferase superfamily protein [Desulfobacteraceae bacterium]